MSETNKLVKGERKKVKVKSMMLFKIYLNVDILSIGSCSYSIMLLFMAYLSQNCSILTVGGVGICDQL